MSHNIEATSDNTDTFRRLWRFTTDNLGLNVLRLVYYSEQHRDSKRHKWRGKFWDYNDERRYHSELERPVVIPPKVITHARAQFMELARTAPIYVGWITKTSLYEEAQ